MDSNKYTFERVSEIEESTNKMLHSSIKKEKRKVSITTMFKNSVDYQASKMKNPQD